MGVYVQAIVDGYPIGMFLFSFSFGTACGAIVFAVATGTTISRSLRRGYIQVLGLSFFDVNAWHSSLANSKALSLPRWQYLFQV
jgi:hypothetical protein